MNMNKHTNITIIKDRLHQFRFPNEPEKRENRSRGLSDLKELRTALISRQLYFCKISDLKNAVYQKEFIPLIPNHKLHGSFQGSSAKFHLFGKSLISLPLFVSGTGDNNLCFCI